MNNISEYVLDKQEVTQKYTQMTTVKSHAGKVGEKRMLGCILENLLPNAMNLHLNRTADCE